jgi:hypothetical protein
MPVDLPDVGSATPTVSEVVALALAFACAVRRALDLVVGPSFFELVGEVGCSYAPAQFR